MIEDKEEYELRAVDLEKGAFFVFNAKVSFYEAKEELLDWATKLKHNCFKARPELSDNKNIILLMHKVCVTKKGCFQNFYIPVIYKPIDKANEKYVKIQVNYASTVNSVVKGITGQESSDANVEVRVLKRKLILGPNETIGDLCLKFPLVDLSFFKFYFRYSLEMFSPVIDIKLSCETELESKQTEDLSQI